MLTKVHWTLALTAPKNQNQLLPTYASAYLFGTVYRICFSNAKQKYYFAIPAESYSEEELKSVCESFFALHRQDMEVAKCVRCGKWHVLEGQFCERCKVSVASSDNNGTEFDIDV